MFSQKLTLKYKSEHIKGAKGRLKWGSALLTPCSRLKTRTFSLTQNIIQPTVLPDNPLQPQNFTHMIKNVKMLLFSPYMLKKNKELGTYEH